MISRFVEPKELGHLVWKWGMPAELWIANLEYVADFINRYDIAPIPPEHMLRDDPVPIVVLGREVEEKFPRVFPPRPFPGGLRVPHLHFKGDFYPLEEEMWAEFSRAMVERFKAKLERMETVNFAQMLELSAAVESF